MANSAPLILNQGMQNSKDRAAEEVIAAERRWGQAHRDLDLDALENLLEDDYVQIRPDGSVIGKREALESYRSGYTALNGKSIYPDSVLS